MRLPTGVVKMENRSGPRTEPCGTPDDSFTVRERQPPTTMNCSRRTKYDASHRRTTQSKPKRSFARSRRRRWSSVPNAALMSSDIRTDGDALSVAVKRSLTTLVMAVSVEWRARYADCYDPRFGEFPMWLLICFMASLSRIFPIVLRFVIGRKFAMSLVPAPGFFNRGAGTSDFDSTTDK